MRILLFGDSYHVLHTWNALINPQQHEIAAALIGTQPPPDDPYDLCVVLWNDTDMAHQSWLAQLPLPILLITPALAISEVLVTRIPHLRVIAHPSRADYQLPPLLYMATHLHAGVAMLGPLFFEDAQLSST